MISGRIIFTGCGSNGNSSRSVRSTSSSHVSTPWGSGSTEKFIMEGQYPTIRLLEFQGDGSDYPEKHLFICEKIWAIK
jgi:hypothetical protein